MSLINQMLKDLAQRSKPQADPEVLLSGLVAPIPVHFKKKRIQYKLVMSAAFGSLICIMLGIKTYQFAQLYINHTVSPVIYVKPSLPFLPPAANTKLMAPPAYNNTQTGLTGITFQTQNNMTNIRLLLNQNTLYRVTGNGHDRVMIVLENTHSIATLPQLDTLNSAINLIRMFHQADGNLKIILKLMPGAELSHIELNGKDKSSELQIDLNSKNMNVPSALQNDSTEERRVNSIKKISYDSTVDDEYRQIMSYENQGLSREAVARLTTFLEKYAGFIPARKSLVTLLLKQHNLPRALEVINAGLQLEPIYLPYIQLKAQVLVAKGNVREALDLLLAQAPPIDENPEYHAFIAALYQRANKAELAEKLYEQLVGIQPNNSIWWMGLGIARVALNKNADALDAFQKADSNTLSPELKVYIENQIRALQG